MKLMFIIISLVMFTGCKDKSKPGKARKTAPAHQTTPSPNAGSDQPGVQGADSNISNWRIEPAGVMNNGVFEVPLNQQMSLPFNITGTNGARFQVAIDGAPQGMVVVGINAPNPIVEWQMPRMGQYSFRLIVRNMDLCQSRQGPQANCSLTSVQGQQMDPINGSYSSIQINSVYDIVSPTYRVIIGGNGMNGYSDRDQLMGQIIGILGQGSDINGTLGGLSNQQLIAVLSALTSGQGFSGGNNGGLNLLLQILAQMNL